MVAVKGNLSVQQSASQYNENASDGDHGLGFRVKLGHGQLELYGLSSRGQSMIPTERYGMVWNRMAWYSMVLSVARHGMMWYGLVWCGMAMVWHGVAWCGMVWYGMARCGMVWHGVVWYGMGGMVWYGIAWHGMV